MLRFKSLISCAWLLWEMYQDVECARPLLDLPSRYRTTAAAPFMLQRLIHLQRSLFIGVIWRRREAYICCASSRVISHWLNLSTWLGLYADRSWFNRRPYLLYVCCLQMFVSLTSPMMREYCIARCLRCKVKMISLDCRTSPVMSSDSTPIADSAHE